MTIEFSHDHKGKYVETKNEFGTFHSYENLKIHSHPHKVLVFLPQNYDKTGTGFPVVYMNDGNTAFTPNGMGPWSWNIDQKLNFLYEHKVIPHVITVAVFPVNRSIEYLDVKRYYDFGTDILFKGGGIAEYSNFIAYDLKVFIDNNYNTDPYSEKTSVVGSSFGGLAAFHTACTHSGLFGMAGVMSPSFEVYAKDGEVNKISFTHEIEKALRKTSCKPKLWIDWGKLEPEAPKLIPQVIEILKNDFGYVENKDLYYMEDPLGTHDERAWSYRFGLMMEIFYSN